MSAPTFIDPAALMRIRHLELRARVVVEGFRTGLHRSPYHGFSVEFTEYRPYVSGDDTRYLDWRVFARRDRSFIKKFEDETNVRCHLLVDQSRSMSFGSLGFTKAHYAATLAATLAQFLDDQGDAVGLLTFDDQVRDFLPARHRTGHLRRLMLALERPASGQATNLEAPLARLAELVHQRSLVVLISDFLAPLDRLETNLAALAAGRHEISVFQVLDPAELTFDFAHAAVFEDLESSRDLFIDPTAARADYLARFNAHNAAVRALCEKHGVAFQRLTTSEPLELALFEFLQQRQRRTRTARHAGPSRASA